MLLREAAPGQRSVHAVRGVSFTAYRGEAIGLIGPNGSGKSTLLRAIAGLMAPSQGVVWTRGQASLLGVSAAMMGEMSGDQNIVLGCLAIGMTPAEIAEEYDAICEFAGIGEFVHLPMNTYSSGMGARLRFAIAAARAPEILLIDEALATGDAEFRRRSEERIRELREQAGTVFLVSHGLGIVRETCNRAIWLEKRQDHHGRRGQRRRGRLRGTRHDPAVVQRLAPCHRSGVDARVHPSQASFEAGDPGGFRAAGQPGGAFLKRATRRGFLKRTVGAVSALDIRLADRRGRLVVALELFLVAVGITTTDMWFDSVHARLGVHAR